MKKKKPSLTATIARLKEDLQNTRGTLDRTWQAYRAYRDELNAIKKVCPVKYYLIQYKIKANTDIVCDYEEVIQAYSAEHAIEKVKEDKTHANTFVLTHITLMA